MELILVEWIDSGIGAHGWTDKGDKDSIAPVNCVSIGVHIGDTEDGEAIKLISSLNDSCYLHGVSIPKGCIKRIRKLRCLN